jgi:hypothetical protein
VPVPIGNRATYLLAGWSRNAPQGQERVITPEGMAKSGSEHAHQCALFCWSAVPATQLAFPLARLMFAIPNGGLRDKITSSNLKQEGVKAGTWDVFLPVPRRGYHGLWLEMKAGKNRLTSEQIEFEKNVLAQGYATRVCYSYIEAIEAVTWYLGE